MSPQKINRFILTFMEVFLITVFSAYGAPHDPDSCQQNYLPYLENELIVGLDTTVAGVDSSSIRQVNNQFGTEVAGYIKHLEIFQLSIPGIYDLDSIAQEIEALEIISFAHPNYFNDTLNSIQGSFPIGDIDRLNMEDQWAWHMLALGEAHEYSTGRGVTVAVLDGGVDYRHPQLRDCTIMRGYDYVDDDGDPFDEPGGVNHGHGTFIAGIIHLTAPEAVIMAYRVCTPSGKGNGFVLARAIMQAVDDQCDVINLSLVMHKESQHHALESVIEYARQNDVIVVAGAGNIELGGINIHLYPAEDPNVITVAAIDPDKKLAAFSCHGKHIDVCAPGVEIYSTYIDKGNYINAWWSGTCFSASFVSGQAALIIARNLYDSSYSLIRDIIVNTAEDIDPLNPEHEGQLGQGLINPVAALKYVDSLFPENTCFEKKSGTEDIDIRNYPDPFHIETVISYYLADPTHVKLEIFNLLGRRVATLIDEFQPAGRYEVKWSRNDNGGKPLASGIYFYRIKTDASITTRKIMLLK